VQTGSQRTQSDERVQLSNITNSLNICCDLLCNLSSD
jgi:hypothetical protein